MGHGTEELKRTLRVERQLKYVCFHCGKTFKKTLRHAHPVKVGRICPSCASYLWKDIPIKESELTNKKEGVK